MKVESFLLSHGVFDAVLESFKLSDYDYILQDIHEDEYHIISISEDEDGCKELFIEPVLTEDGTVKSHDTDELYIDLSVNPRILLTFLAKTNVDDVHVLGL